MKPSSRGQSCCRAGPFASTKTAAGISCVLETFLDCNNSGLTYNRSPSQTSSSSDDANGNAATSRLRAGVIQPVRRQYRSRCRTAVRTCELVNRRGVSAARVVRNKSRREVVRQKQRGRLVPAHLRALQADKGHRAVSRTRRNKSHNMTVQPAQNSRTARYPVAAKAESHGRCKNKLQTKARTCHSSNESTRSSVSRYKVVSKPKQSEELCSSCSGHSRRCRPKLDSFDDSPRRSREHHRHKNRSSNRRLEESSSSNRSIASQCCQYRDRSPLQSPLKSSTCHRQDSTMRLNHRSKNSRGHHKKNCNRSSRNSESSSRSDIEEVDRERRKQIRDGNRKCKRDRKRRGFFACVLM